jgi:hypothetical protein
MAKITAMDVDNLRIPTPAAENFGDPRGRADPDVLRAAAWGTDFDVNGRRNAIAQALTSQPAAQAQGPTAAQQYLQAIGWQGTEQQYYDSLGGNEAAMAMYRNAGGGGAAAPSTTTFAGSSPSSGPVGGFGATPAQQYLQAIGWQGTEPQYYDSLGGPEAAIALRKSLTGS